MNFITVRSRAWRQALGQLWRQPVGSLFTLLVIASTLVLPLGFYLLLANARDVAGRLPAEPELSVYLRVEAEAQDVAKVKAAIAHLAQVKSSRFIPRAAALDELQQSAGQIDVLAGLDGNPLPDAFILTLNSREPEVIHQVSAELLALPAVDQVQHDAAWQERLRQWLGLGQQLVWLLAVSLGMALTVTTANTIRLQILTRRDEIEVSRLIGATAAFVRRPFLYHAMLQGLLGSLLAIGLCELARAWLAPEVTALAKSYASQFVLRGANWLEMACVIGPSIGLCMLGAWIAVSRHLSRI